MKLYIGAGVVIEHTIDQRNYVDWKYGYLSDLATKPPTTYRSSGKVFYYFRVRANPFTRKVRRLGPHPLTPKFLELITHPIALAVWYCDDGTYGNSNIHIFTCNFAESENELLLRWLKERWGLTGNIVKCYDRKYEKSYRRIVLDKGSSLRLLEMTCSYIVEAFPHKLPPWYALP